MAIGGESGRVERALAAAIYTFLIVFVLGAPHSIAVTQGAFVVASVLWVARMIVARRVIFRRTPVDLPLAIFICWTLLSVATSYVPVYSAGRMRGVSLYLILYLFASNVERPRRVWTLSLLLALSSLGNLWWTYYQRYEGRGLKVVAIEASSPLAKWSLQPGDTILSIAGARARDLAQFDAAFDVGDGKAPIAIRFLRGEGELETAYRRQRVRRAGEGPDRLGIEVTPGRDFRARAYFSHPVTYAETLQLLASVAFAWLFVAGRRRPGWAVGMGLLMAAILGALVMTETRASLVAFGLSCIAMALVRGTGRRGLVALACVVALGVGAGAFQILRGRGVGIVDLRDQSTTWRLTVWREGLRLVAEHPVVGIGPDTAHETWRAWGLFKEGDQQLPPGHWHSTPLQIAVDRGLPALVAWIAVMVLFFVSIGRLARRLRDRERDEGDGDWRVSAAVLGAWGATVGFAVSSFVHFNWGDSEVIEIVWALMGIAFAALGMYRDGPPAPDAEVETPPLEERDLGLQTTS
jgi:hypothetical protein